MDCFPELQILICEFSQISLNPKRKSQKWDFLFDCLLRSAPSALCYAILAVSPQSVIPSGAKFESRKSYLRSMRILIGQEVQRLRRCSILWIPHFTKLRGASKETLILRLYRRFPSCFQKIKKALAKDHLLMLQYWKRWDGPAFLSANFLLAQTAWFVIYLSSMLIGRRPKKDGMRCK